MELSYNGTVSVPVSVTTDAEVDVKIRVECLECGRTLRITTPTLDEGEIVVYAEPCGNCIEEAVAQSHGE